MNIYVWFYASNFYETLPFVVSWNPAEKNCQRLYFHDGKDSLYTCSACYKCAFNSSFQRYNVLLVIARLKLHSSELVRFRPLKMYHNFSNLSNLLENQFLIWCVVTYKSTSCRGQCAVFRWKKRVHRWEFDETSSFREIDDCIIFVRYSVLNALGETFLTTNCSFQN